MANDIALIPVSDIERMACAIAKSGLFGMKTVDQALALMLIAQAEGKHPATAAQEYHIIQGRPALKADAMLARFQTAGGKVDWGEYSDKRVVGKFSHPQGGSVEIIWTFDQARAIGLTGKDNWKHYPRAMLRARVISEGIRTVYPGIAVGVYTPEEVQDFEPARPAEKIISPVANALEGTEEPSAEIMEFLRELAAILVQMIEIDGNPTGAYMHLVEQNLDTEQKLILWQILGPNTKTRAALKKEGAIQAKNSRGEIANAVEDVHSQPAA
jgi:hypothetical protein